MNKLNFNNDLVTANQNLKEAYVKNVPYRKGMVDSNGEEIVITTERPYLNLAPNRQQRRAYLKNMSKIRRYKTMLIDLKNATTEGQEEDQQSDNETIDVTVTDGE